MFAASAGAHAADVQGHVSLANGRDAGDAVVYLDGAGRAMPMPRAMVDQRRRTFFPHVSIVTVGTEVSFPNNDNVYHNVFADYDAKRFDLGMYPRGTVKKQSFPKPGLVVLMCSIHPEMSAYIMVVDTPYFAVTDGSGRFRIDNVPAGSYTVKVWHESGQVDSEVVQVRPGTQLSLRTHRGRL